LDNYNYLQGLCHWQWAKEIVYLTLARSRNTNFGNCVMTVTANVCNVHSVMGVFSLAQKKRGRGDTEDHVKTVKHKIAINATASANI
jgi:hypothetical protein